MPWLLAAKKKKLLPLLLLLPLPLLKRLQPLPLQPLQLRLLPKHLLLRPLQPRHLLASNSPWESKPRFLAGLFFVYFADEG